MLVILDGNSNQVSHVKNKNYELSTAAVELNKCLKQIEFSIFLTRIYVPISEIPSIKSTMEIL